MIRPSHLDEIDVQYVNLSEGSVHVVSNSEDIHVRVVSLSLTIPVETRVKRDIK